MPQPPNRRGAFLPYKLKSKLKNACSTFGQALEHEKCKIFAPGSEMCGKRSCRNWCVSAIWLWNAGPASLRLHAALDGRPQCKGTWWGSGAEFGNCPHGCFVPGPWHCPCHQSTTRGTTILKQRGKLGFGIVYGTYQWLRYSWYLK